MSVYPEEARKGRANLKVLFTTAYARNAIVHDGRLDPGVELLPNPFTHAALGEKLRDMIDARSTPARVLVVEDETLIQMLATENLEEAGLRVDSAVSAAEALNKLRLIPGSVDAWDCLTGRAMRWFGKSAIYFAAAHCNCERPGERSRAQTF